MDRLTSFSQLVTETTQELCDLLLSTYHNKLKETSKNEKLGIKTTVQAIVVAKQQVVLPDPETREDFIKWNDFSWCLQWNGRTFSAWHSDVETPLKVGKFTRIGVYVDYTRGLLAFYGVADSMTLIHQYQAEFLEPLYPAFWLSKKENVVLLVTPGDTLPLKSPSPPSTPPSGATTLPAQVQ
ncbi:hypothetical protein JZ751_015738 [Albula glossodonta]|uniref:B30.2/SPRY domain-containing protein n=1 Tax=Albula glossodonta TaxID=121402 RepID=A0A8T2N3B3_9TELE|nr:hypothetical protein JZ751_015738 [Albula glossodonta]